MQELRQSTAVTVKLGPFVDATDGVTAETALTIQKADVRLSKNGGNMAAASADQGTSDAGAPHDELGVYDGSLDTTDTGTLGRLRIDIQESGAAPWFKEFMILTAEEWDAKYSTGIRQANVTQISGDGTAADNAEAFFDGTGYAGTNNVIPTVTTLTNAPPDSAGVTTLLSRIPAALFSGITSLAQWLGLIAGKQTGNSTARTEIRATGAGSGTYDETTDSLEAIRDAGASPGDIADAVWDEDITGHSTADSAGEALQNAGAAGTPPTAGEVADAVWDEALSGHTTAGTAGERLGRVPNAAAGGNGGLPTVDANNRIAGIQGTINTLDGLDTAQDAQHATTQGTLSTMDGKLDAIAGYIDTEISSIITSLNTIAGYLDTEIAAILADTNELQTDLANGGRLDLLIDAIKAVTDLLPDAGALSSLAQDSTVAKEATLTSTGRGDPSALAGALGGSLSLAAKIDWLFAKAMRPVSFNKTTGEEIIENSAGTDIAKATAADDATTTSRGAYGAP